MKVVLLAAGRSVRMQPIPDKNFLNFLGQPLIAHQLSALLSAGFKEILIMGGKHNLSALRAFLCASKFKNARISVREQADLSLGMAGAVLSASTWIKNEPFLLVSGNDVVDSAVYGLARKNIEKNSSKGLLAAQKVKKYFPGGYLKINPRPSRGEANNYCPAERSVGGATLRGIVKTIVEKPGQGREPSKLVNIVIHYHPDPRALINALKKVSSDRDDRYEKALQALFDAGTPYHAAPFEGFWQPVKYPWHALSLMNYYLESLPKGVHKGKNVEIAQSARLRGNVWLEDGARVLDNAVIQGPAYIGRTSVIATNALVRQSHIGENCVIGFGSEVARSHVGNNVWTHINYIGDSIIGSDVSFGAGAVIGNLRLDERNVFVAVNGGGKADCGSNKFGLVTGDHIRVGVNTSFMPGVKVGSNSFVGAGIVVGEDIPEGSFVTGQWELKIKPNREKITPRI